MKELNEETYDTEFDKLNYQMLKETKNTDNQINESETTSTKVVFTNGNTYTYVQKDKTVYLNDNVKIAEKIDKCTFGVTTTSNQKFLVTNVKIGKATRSSKYVLYYSLPKMAGKRVTENTEYIDNNGDTAIIPKGFTISGIDGEQTISKGLVIYLVPEDTTVGNWKADTDSNGIYDVKEQYDQFVWIPVSNANNMFMCQAKTARTMCNFKIEGNEVICQTHKTADATKSKKMAGRLYATSTGENFNSSLTTQTYNANRGLREPAIVTGNSTGTGTSYDGSSTDNSIGLTLATLQEEYNSAVKKVIQSGGFWVGRYETSGIDSSNDDTAVSIVAGKGTSDGINKRNWYRMYKQQQNYANKKGLATEENTSIQSTMIFGVAYDQIVKYANCASETTPKRDYSAVKTGNVPTDCYKNIYDLCGNLSEWTTEAYSTTDRVHRGAYFDISYSASYRLSNYPTLSSSNYIRYQSHTLRNANRTPTNRLSTSFIFGIYRNTVHRYRI